MTVFGPSFQLLTTAGDGKSARRFVLSSRGWFDLQTRLLSLLALPGTYAEYERCYGSATSGPRMKECFAAMNKLRDAASRYGNPRQARTNIQHNPAVLLNAERPRHDTYAAALWTMGRVRRDAVALAAELTSMPATSRGTAARDAVREIKARFFNAGQIADQMQQSVIHLNTLINEFQVLFDELENAQAIMRIYTDSKSAMQRTLNQELGPWQAAIAELERERASAYARWLGLTISGCQIPAMIGIVGTAAMVMLAAPAKGASFAVGTGPAGSAGGMAVAGMGIAAGLARSAYEELIAQLGTMPGGMQRHLARRHDLGALDAAMRSSLPAISDVIDQLTVVREAWADVLREIKYRVGGLDAHNLATATWLREAEMAGSAAHWIEVDAAIQVFLGGSFVDSAIVRFGAALPKDDPDWRQSLLRQIAA